jgi:biopolymer transport protein ExbB/TolQ
MNITETFKSFTLLGAEWVLWLLIGLSIASVAVMIERIRFFRARTIDLPQLINDVKRALSRGETSQVRDRWASSRAMAAIVALRGLEEAERGADAAAETMTSIKTLVKQEHERNLAFLGTLGNNAPFIGLFGTVLGIIVAFQDLANNPQGDAAVVMDGISEALVATAVGLMVAIPAVVMFNYLNRRVRAAVAGTDSVAHTILGELKARADAQRAS